MYRNPEHFVDPAAEQAIQRPLPIQSSLEKHPIHTRKTPVKTAVMSETQFRQPPVRIILEVSTARYKSCGTRMGAIFRANSAKRAVEAWDRRVV